MNIYRGRTHTEVYLASVLYDSIEDQDIKSVTTLLVEKQADPNIVLPGKGISCFHLVIGNDSPKFAMEATLLIIQNGGDPNVLSDEGLTPVHIAAAWGRTDILTLLLNCGGDPELTDNCYKSALHYAKDEGWDEATILIKDFISCQRHAVHGNFSNDIRFTIALDKILLSNGYLVGEYEIVKTEDNVITQMDLNTLPQINGQEYVSNWCKNQELNSNSIEFTDDSSSVEQCRNTAFIESINNFDSKKSSAALSNKSTFSNLSSNFSLELKSEISPRKFNNITMRNKKYNNYISKDICNYKESCRESGILTLLDSSEEFNEYLDEVKKKSPLRSNSEIAKNFENLDINDKRDASSDYCTCTEISEAPNGLEKSMYNFFTNKISYSRNSDIDNDNQDVSFISVSEVYKYTDSEEGITLYERRTLIGSISGSQNESVDSGSSFSSLPKSFDYDTDTLRKELIIQGFHPGPITKTTKRVYLRKLYKLKKQSQVTQFNWDSNGKAYSSELQNTLTNKNWHENLSQYQYLEDLLRKQFLNPDSSRKWREGITKSSFTYLLLDSRITQNLPHRYDQLKKHESWETFLSAIFYIGKGKRSRPFSHLYEAVNSYNKREIAVESKKVNRILDIWNDNHGVICLHVFQNVIAAEAYTREAAMISALKLDNITNIKVGDFYGITATWSQKQKKLLGVYLLYKAMKIFLNEGERQIFPKDIE